MIISCPSCATRYSLPAQESGALAITCRVCGHHWQQPELIEAIDVTEVSAKAAPAVIEHDDAPELEIRRLTRIAEEATAFHAAKRTQRQRRARQWATFGFVLLAPFAAAAALPETVVKVAPVSIRIYETLGYDINLRGLDIRSIEQQHAIINGTRVLAVKGEVRNISDASRKMPFLRFTLDDAQGREVYAWNLDTGTQTLAAGETTNFITRVEMPPESARDLKIRFAQTEEIGSPKSSLQQKP